MEPAASAEPDTASAAAPRDEPPHDHLVGFYVDDAFLARSVVDFVAAAWRTGEGVVIIATPDHRARIEAGLVAQGLDVTMARDRGWFVMADAETTCATFTRRDGTLDAARFDRVVPPLLDSVARGGRNVRVFGEMVALLWAAGDVTAALELEDRWNELARSRTFSLFCAYPLRDVAGSADFGQVCERHSAVTIESDVRFREDLAPVTPTGGPDRRG